VRPKWDCEAALGVPRLPSNFGVTTENKKECRYCNDNKHDSSLVTVHTCLFQTEHFDASLRQEFVWACQPGWLKALPFPGRSSIRQTAGNPASIVGSRMISLPIRRTLVAVRSRKSNHPDCKTAVRSGKATHPSGDGGTNANEYYFTSSTDKMFPAGSLNHAILGPSPPRAIPFLSVFRLGKS
jgi:hypothetical protein